MAIAARFVSHHNFSFQVSALFLPVLCCVHPVLSNVKLCRQRHFVLSAAEIYLNLFFIPPDIVSVTFSFHVAKEKEPARRNFNSAPFLRILSDSCEIVWIFILVSTEKLLRSTCIVCSTRANPGDALVLKQKYNPAQ